MTDCMDMNDILRERGVDGLRGHMDRNGRVYRREGGSVPFDEGPGGLDGTSMAWGDPTLLHRRPWIYGRSLMRGKVSLLVAPGGAGTTAYTCTLALALVTGQKLLHDHVWDGPKRVRLWSLEEDRDEMRRRLEAARKHFRLGRPEGLILTCAHELALRLVHDTPNGPQVDEGLARDLISSLKRQRIDALVVDPLIATHTLCENDNSAMDLLMRTWSRIAAAADCAIVLVHHTGKLNGNDATADASRGASAVVAAARVAETLNPMSEEDAARWGIESRYQFVRLGDAKSNYARRDADRWHALADVELGNGDHVGVMTAWTPPDPMQGVTVEHLDEVARRARSGAYRVSAQSPEWIGRMIADVMGADLSNTVEASRVRTSLSAWLKTGALRVEERPDDKRRMRKYVVSGTCSTSPPSGGALVEQVEQSTNVLHLNTGRWSKVEHVERRPVLHPPTPKGVEGGGATRVSTGPPQGGNEPAAVSSSTAPPHDDDRGDDATTSDMLGPNALRHAILAALLAAPGALTQKAIRGRADLPSPPSRSAVDKSLRRLLEAGEVVKAGKGLWRLRGSG